MDSPTFFNKHFMSSDFDHDDYNNTTSTPENSSGSPPPPPAFNDVVFSKIASSPKKSSRRALQKRVVSIPIKENSNTNTPPPSDSWAWRKYGQKPIKGSPYPRGYYRCSSSKGCPARKQVERSRADPTMLMITYSSEHNHPWPASSRSHHGNSKPEPKAREEQETAAPQPEPEPEETRRFADLGEEESSSSALVIIPSAAHDEFGWFASEMETTSSRVVLESPIFADSGADVGDVAGMVFPMGEEDESLFADLGELPECSLVFRHRRVGGGGVGPQAQIC